ncbi:ABC protein [Macrolepiota fuliginosa MF-IS2]|uniref:ABC protein n=1 Tax=Macrolepiota fuliginosa MF-IS2 TaxID=1400762 RepID=A0A9P6C4J4_9AGAR|nr:ABC protein [Macrolepiota fuliginosa MF-IS2]
MSKAHDSSEKLPPDDEPQGPTNQAIDLDRGEELVRYRKHWWQLWIPKDPPPPPPDSIDSAPITPLANASIFSIFTYTWVTPLMNLGYQRTLQASDLWQVDESRAAATLSARLDDAWKERARLANDWNQALRRGEIKPGLFQRMVWCMRSLPSGKRFKESFVSYETEWRQKTGLRKPSLVFAMNDTLGRFFWSGGAIKVVGDMSQLMGPLLVKAIINFAKERGALKARGEAEPSLGRGIGMAIGLFFLIVLTSLMQHQFFWRSMMTGILSRTTLISSIYKRGVRLTGKSRVYLPNSQLVNHISTDVSRIDAAAQWFHAAWTAPIQVLVCLVILLVQLGPAALAGFALFLLMVPMSSLIASHQFKIRRKSMKFTDQRSKTLLEVLGGMRVVKYFSYEIAFLKRINEVRENELEGVKKISHSQSASVAFAYSTPVLAATLSLLVYTKINPDFDVAVVFASLSLFQLLRQPMMLLPRALSAITDSRNAFQRLSAVFEAELMPENAFTIDKDQEYALDVSGATFEWEETQGGAAKKPFQVQDITMQVKRGSLTAVVGRVGSGKSSLLQGLIGEVRMLSGKVTFGGELAYCPQVAWIQNATLRENILFGRPYDEERYWKVIDDSCLLPDLRLLADGDLTEIGEKGINLSGGQKQRINIARALYSSADVLIFDDPLSAVDAHVGRSLFHNAILNSVRTLGKTVILVTHALHFVSYCDEIYMIENGFIKEHGTYQGVVEKEGDLARLTAEFGGANDSDSVSDGSSNTAQDDSIDEEKQRSQAKAAGTGRLEGRLIVKERRTTGSVPAKVYWKYLSAGRGFLTMPLLLLSIFFMQGSQIMNTYTLVWWQANTLDRPFSFYQGLYAGLGISQAIFTLTLGIVMDTISWFVSGNLHHEAVRNIFYAPMSFFDTTPVGRIMGIFGKDTDSIDNQLPISMRLLALTLSSVVGAVVIITVVEHYFIIVVVVISLGYQHFQGYYRASAREVKRLDAMLRSILYAHFSESLTGLPTIRSYGETTRFLRENKYYIDLENRALFLTVSNQRWLAVRLDFCGAIMVVAVAIFVVVGATAINPAQVGLVLTYTTSLTQLCGLLTRQTADVENYMNSVERVVHYSRKDMIEQEAPHEVPENKPSADWPQHGSVEFNDVKMSYRPGLPNVLHGISMSVKGGEKVGVVGRTGAGKSSLVLTLLRIVEYSGQITIDGVDIGKLGLRDLRTKVSIIPQDPLIFSGTVRTALDPFGLFEDARLWDALRRSSLIGPGSPGHDLSEGQAPITLDTVIEPEGANLSVGERSLLSLARALVKNSKVVILDEATASVDLETDKKIQHTITTEFRDRTLLCIAHRLRTILSYDRILVLDAGCVAEYDTPEKLFQKGGIFRSLCERSNISLQDIQTA